MTVYRAFADFLKLNGRQLTIDTEAVIRIFESGFYGDGRDGDLIFAQDTTLQADVRAVSVTVAPGVRVSLAGFEISATRVISVGVGSIISDDGASAAGAIPGAQRSVLCTAGLAGGAGGGPGANGQRTATLLALLGNESSSSYEPIFGGTGGSGGSGAGGNGGGLGNGNGGVNSSNFVYDPTLSSPLNGPMPTSVAYVFSATDPSTLAVLPLGCGGGGGGGGGTPGAGGAGGGIVRLRSPKIINNGLISANGGNGGNGVGSGAGGGGGGGGGRIILVGERSGSGTLSVEGGIGGRGGTFDADPGINGQVGTIHLFG